MLMKYYLGYGLCPDHNILTKQAPWTFAGTFQKVTHLSRGIQISGCLANQLFIYLLAPSLYCRQAVTPDPYHRHWSI